MTMAYISLNYETLQLSTFAWLFMQSLPLYIAFLAFQSVFFDRFIACFKVKGNVGYFIALIDFVGYVGTVSVLMIKEIMDMDFNWFVAYNYLSATVGIISAVAFSLAIVFIVIAHRKEQRIGASAEQTPKEVEIEVAPTIATAQ